MDGGFDMYLGIPPREVLRWYLVGFVEAATFAGLVFLALIMRPMWLGVVVLVVGMFASGAVWILILRNRAGGPLKARKIPK